jgi:hypothetical protein
MHDVKRSPFPPADCSTITHVPVSESWWRNSTESVETAGGVMLLIRGDGSRASNCSCKKFGSSNCLACAWHYPLADHFRIRDGLG